MNKIIERIVVSKYPPTSDCLWIDISSDVPVMKISFGGKDWIEVNSPGEIPIAIEDGDDNLENQEK